MTEHVDALSQTLARESRHIVSFGLSGTTSRAAVLILTRPSVRRKRKARIPRPARAKGFCLQGFLRDWSRIAASRMAGATRREESDDGIDLDRRSRRATEKALGRRAFGQPDRRRARERDPKCGDRQGASAGPVRP